MRGMLSGKMAESREEAWTQVRQGKAPRIMDPI